MRLPCWDYSYLVAAQGKKLGAKVDAPFFCRDIPYREGWSDFVGVASALVWVAQQCQLGFVCLCSLRLSGSQGQGRYVHKSNV